MILSDEASGCRLMPINSTSILYILKIIIFRPVPLQLLNTEILLHFLELAYYCTISVRFFPSVFSFLVPQLYNSKIMNNEGPNILQQFIFL